MCGRFALIASPEQVAEFLALTDLAPFPPRYNIAPTQPVLVAVAGERREEGSNLPSRQSVLVRWGFWPGWLKDPSGFPLLINARSEDAAGKPAFRAAMRHRRTLVPAPGFYEWRKEGARKQPYWIRPKRGGIVAFGGLMETWQDAGGSELDTGAILTTAASPDLAPIHNRMPVVIEPQHFDEWLDCRNNEPRDVVALMRPAEEGMFEAIAVSDLVNKVANVGPQIMESLGAPVTDTPGKRDRKKDGDQLDLF